MSNKDATGLVVGGEPRIDFLPPEVKARKQARKTQRSLIVLVLLVLVACAGGYVFATSLALQAQAALAAEQDKTTTLLSQQTEFAEARTVAEQLAAVQDARIVGTASEILWKEYLAELRATLPSGMAITQAEVDSMSAIDLAPVPTVPLETERVATITLTANAPTLASIASWLDNVRELRGFADVWSGPATWDDGHYEVEIRLNVNSDAFEKRFFEGYGDAEPGAEADDVADDESDETLDGGDVETPGGTVPPESGDTTTGNEG